MKSQEVVNAAIDTEDNMVIYSANGRDGYFKEAVKRIKSLREKFRANC